MARDRRGGRDGELERTFACTGMEPYATFVLAQRVADRRMRRRERHENLVPYRCPACGLIHIGEPSLGPHRGSKGRRRGRWHLKGAW